MLKIKWNYFIQKERYERYETAPTFIESDAIGNQLISTCRYVLYALLKSWYMHSTRIYFHRISIFIHLERIERHFCTVRGQHSSLYTEFLPIQAHIDECGQILERCPNKCVAYVERKLIADHLRECARVGDKSVPKVCTHPTDDDDRFSIMEENVTALRTVLNEEIRQRHRLISDVGVLRKQNQNTDDWITKVGDVLTVLKKCLNDETETRSIEIKNCTEDIERLMYQYKARKNTHHIYKENTFNVEFLQEVKEWRKELRRLLDHIHEDLEFRNNVTANIETLFSDNQISVSKITALELALENQKNTEMDQNERLSGVPADFHRHPSDLEAKLASLTLEVKQMKHIVCETEDKCDRMERLVRDARKSNAKTRQELRDLEIHLKIQKKMAAICNVDGNLIWRIDQFASKLQDAKETDTFIKSPLFCNKQYGYTLRVGYNYDIASYQSFFANVFIL